MLCLHSHNFHIAIVVGTVGNQSIFLHNCGFFFQTTGGELKSKPTQMSVRELRGFGLTPDLVCYVLSVGHRR